MLGKPRWDVEGRDWPNREASEFLNAGGIRWHVQRFGSGPAILLLHGTGAGTHSWRHLAPRLARDYAVIAPDLPGHAFTQSPAQASLSLSGMAMGVRELLNVLDVQPVIAVGHSAGAAILARMALDGWPTPPRTIISVNGALLPLRGVSGHLFSPIAKLLARSSLPPRLFASRAAKSGLVRTLIRDTGSKLEPEGIELYARLARCPGHVAAALGMMAHWDLASLAAALPGLSVPLVLAAGSHDRTIPPSDAYRVQALIPRAIVESLEGLGHLAHEENPAAVDALIRRRA